jgi:hypothetical protein
MSQRGKMGITAKGISHFVFQRGGKNHFCYKGENMELPLIKEVALSFLS